MVLEEKTLDLLKLLTTHAGDTSPTILVVPQPPTPALTHASSGDAIDKKGKRVQKGKGSKDVEEGEDTFLITPSQEGPNY